MSTAIGKKVLTTLSLAATLFLSGCGADEAGKLIRDMGEDGPIEKAGFSGDGTWGHLWGGRSAWLTQEHPGRVIKICGDHVSELAAGVRAWSKVAGRDGELWIVENAGKACDTRDVSAGRNIFVIGRSRPEAAKLCEKFPKAVALTYVDHGAVVVCDETSKMSEVMLHEAGHLWGMCDVYPENVTGSSNCDSHYFTGRSRHSVMGANYSKTLAAADIAGMEAMIRRQDVKGNRVWTQTPHKRVTISGEGFSESVGSPTAEFDLNLLQEAPISCVLDHDGTSAL